MRERIALAIGVILRLEHGEQPSREEIVLLQRSVPPEYHDIPIDQLARVVLNIEFERRRTVRRHANG
jgi:hypothetical protein